MDQWQFLEIFISKDQNLVSINELTQFIDFHLPIPDSGMFADDIQGLILIVFDKKHSLALSKFEKNIYENFDSSHIRANIKPFENTGLENFCDSLALCVDQSSWAESIGLQRLKRPTNVLMVLDDDIMVLKQMEKILSGFGAVIAVQNPALFEEEYLKSAPNILFLDIHLKSDKGNNVLRFVKNNLDPNAHIVMISSDTKKNMILDIKDGGADGFIVKPPNRKNIFQHLMKASTFIAKASY